MTQRYKRGELYKLTPDVSELYNPPESIERHKKRYEYARICGYAHNTEIGDVWLIDENGNKHPDFATVGVPLHRDLVTKVDRLD